LLSPTLFVHLFAVWNQQVRRVARSSIVTNDKPSPPPSTTSHTDNAQNATIDAITGDDEDATNANKQSQHDDETTEKKETENSQEIDTQFEKIAL
jgi:hypothetical protein